jgi:hypothetical protein
MGWSDRDGHLGQGDAGSPITRAACRSEFMTFSFDVQVSSYTTRKSPGFLLLWMDEYSVLSAGTARISPAATLMLYPR